MYLRRVTLFSTLLTVLGSLFFGAPAEAQLLKIGQKVPDFQLRDREQTLIRLSRFSKGKVVVVDFFRTDCKPCVKSLVALKKLHKAYGKDKRVRFLVVALLEQDGGEGRLEAFLKKTPVPFPVVVDAYDTVAKKFIAKGNSVQLPSLFVVDKKGVVRWRHTELLTDTKALDKLLRGLL